MDKRRHLRVPFAGKARLSAGEETVDVSTSNMSLGGLLFHTLETFELGQQVTLRLSGTFQEKPFEEEVRGRVVTVHRGPAGNSFGIRFTFYLEAETQPSLHGWVESHQGKPLPSFLRNSAGY